MLEILNLTRVKTLSYFRASRTFKRKGKDKRKCSPLSISSPLRSTLQFSGRFLYVVLWNSPFIQKLQLLTVIYISWLYFF